MKERRVATFGTTGQRGEVAWLGAADQRFRGRIATALAPLDARPGRAPASRGTRGEPP